MYELSRIRSVPFDLKPCYQNITTYELALTYSRPGSSGCLHGMSLRKVHIGTLFGQEVLQQPDKDWVNFRCDIGDNHLQG